eukprot:6314-Heterococcus_DN1.PRE.3
MGQLHIQTKTDITGSTAIHCAAVMSLSNWLYSWRMCNASSQGCDHYICIGAFITASYTVDIMHSYSHTMYTPEVHCTAVNAL